jgi:hypothetical protein
LTNLLIALVLLANASYAISYSICGMTKKISCNCTMDRDDEQGNISSDSYITSKSCCKTEVKTISNSSDFENINKFEINTVSIPIHSTELINLTDNNFINNIGKEILIFYTKSIDIPVKYSSLLI